jgi:glycosyltransferase involved in cell wall biosynthesis
VVGLDLRILVPWYKYPPFSSTSIGGLSVSLWETTRSLARTGASVVVLCPSGNGKENDRDIDGVKVVSNIAGTKIIGNRALERTDEKLFRDTDIIFSVNNFGAKSLSNFRSKVVRQIHTVAHDRPLSTYLSLKPRLTDFPKMFVQKRREMSLERALTGVETVCVSQYNLLKMEEHNLESAENLVRISNGIDTTFFKPTIIERRFDIIFIGRFQKLKGLDILLNAFSLVARKNANFTLAIIGSFSKDEQKYCLNLVQEEIRKNIQFLGLIEHEKLPEFINASKIVVVPSRYESFSLPALEAVACGVPVVAFSVGGIPEIIGKENGILVERVAAEDLASSIMNARKSDDLKESAMRDGPKRAINFDLKTVTKQLHDYFDFKSGRNVKQI